MDEMKKAFIIVSAFLGTVTGIGLLMKYIYNHNVADIPEHEQALIDKIHECQTQIKEMLVEIKQIKTARQQAKKDVQAQNTELSLLLLQQQESYQSVTPLTPTFFKDQTMINVSARLDDLLASYPSFPDDTELNLESATLFYTLNEKHHAEVMQLIAIELPGTYEAINESKVIARQHNIA